MIIGNGVAGTTAAEYIRNIDSDGNITIMTEEDAPFYYRIRINDFISGSIQRNDLIARSDQWYRDRGITLRLNSRIVQGDLNQKTVATSAGENFGYDRLLIATGSHSFIPPIRGSDKKGVFSVRSLQDAKEILKYAQKIQKVVLIGGGLLGLETGNALRKLGKNVEVVEFFSRLLPRQLDTAGGNILLKTMEGMGFSFRLGAKTEAIMGDDKVTGVSLEGGETLTAEMVIISAGVRPNLELAAHFNLENEKGIQVDDWLRTSEPDAFAAGDVAEHNGTLYGIWPAAMTQGQMAGINMAGGDARFTGTTMSNTLKVVEIDLASAGDIDAEEKMESRIKTGDRVYQKIVFDGNRIVGCIMLGDTKAFNMVKHAISEKKDIAPYKDEILEQGFDLKRLLR